MTVERQNCSLDSRLVVEPGYLSVSLPKLNVVAVNELLCLFRGLGIVGAFERKRVEEMAVWTDGVNAVFRHVAAPFE
jgi:hypothetical protein